LHRLELAEQCVESFEVPFPELAVSFQPLIRLREWLSLEAPWTPLRVDPARDQTSALQHFEVL
jgi:hypothetical protein